MLARVVDEAFRLGASPLPRTKRAFDELLAGGLPRIDASYLAFTKVITRAGSELDATLAALRSAAKHPGASVTIAEIRAQLEELFPATLLAWVSLARLEHFPRYLRAAQMRLGRAIADPRKDAEKLEPIVPLWASFLAKRRAARDQDAAHALRWSFEEELRRRLRARAQDARASVGSEAEGRPRRAAVDSHPARPRGRSSGLLGLPVRCHGNVVPLLPIGDSLPVFVLDHLQRPGTKEDAQRWLVGIHHLQDRRPGRLRLAPRATDGPEDLVQLSADTAS